MSKFLLLGARYSIFYVLWAGPCRNHSTLRQHARWVWLFYNKTVFTKQAVSHIRPVGPHLPIPPLEELSSSHVFQQILWAGDFSIHGYSHLLTCPQIPCRLVYIPPINSDCFLEGCIQPKQKPNGFFLQYLLLFNFFTIHEFFLVSLFPWTLLEWKKKSPYPSDRPISNSQSFNSTAIRLGGGVLLFYLL